MSFTKLKMTNYFMHVILKRRPEIQTLEDEIISILDHPSKVVTQEDGRKRYYGFAKNGKWLRIIIDGDSIHNVFYDRSFKY